MDFLEKSVISENYEREKISDNIIDLFCYFTQRAVYQCPECGCIFIDNPDNSRNLFGFKPEEDVNRKLLISADGEKWRGRLYGDWYDNPPEWQKSKGQIYSKLNIYLPVEYFDNFDDFNKRYYELLNELDNKNLICSAILNINNKRMFWKSEKINYKISD